MDEPKKVRLSFQCLINLKNHKKMRKFYVFTFIMFSFIMHGQTVSTILNDAEADVDDALAFDSKGNLYGSNFAGNAVYKITPSGEVSEFVTGIVNPNGLAFDSKDNLYVVDYTTEGKIRKYDIDGNLLNTFMVGEFPSGIIKAFRRDAMIFTHADFGNAENNSINELLPDGTVRQIYQGAPLNVPVGLTYDYSGTLYIGNYLDRKIYKLKPYQNELEYVATVPDSGTNAPFLAFITYARGFLYGTIYGEHKVFKINPRAIDDVEVFAGSTNGNIDGDISEATFSFPAGIITNRRQDALYISEFSGLGNIRKLSFRRSRCTIRIGLKAYPNPTSEVLNIKVELPESGNFKINISNLFTGENVYNSNEIFDGEEFLKTISVADWSQGFYRLQVSKGGCKRQRIIVVK